MRILFLIVIFVLGAASVAAQEKESKKESKSVPNTVQMSAAQVSKLDTVNKDARLAQLELENLQLRIEKASEELKKLQEKAKEAVKTAESAYLKEVESIGLSKDSVKEYDVKQNADNSLTFTKRSKDVKQ